MRVHLKETNSWWKNLCLNIICSYVLIHRGTPGKWTMSSQERFLRASGRDGLQRVLQLYRRRKHGDDLHGEPPLRRVHGHMRVARDCEARELRRKQQKWVNISLREINNRRKNIPLCVLVDSGLTVALPKCKARLWSTPSWALQRQRERERGKDGQRSRRYLTLVRTEGSFVCLQTFDLNSNYRPYIRLSCVQLIHFIKKKEFRFSRFLILMTLTSSIVMFVKINWSEF